MRIRTIVLFASAVVSVSAGLWSAPAWAGGGCHTGPTQGTGDLVELVDACFTPSTLHIAPGDTVTFVNRDPIVHNVAGNGWGHLEDMAEGDRFAASFEEGGLYAFACTYHPGMTGVIVVGDGTGAGNGPVVDTALPAQGAVQTAAPVEGPGAVNWIAAGAIGLAIGIGTGWAIERRRRGPRPA